jgi:two-component system, response regulator PdtaR
MLASEGRADRSSPCAGNRLDEEISPVLRGKRVLVVEDDFLVGLASISALEEAGCEVIGPEATLSAALAAAKRETFDAAILDINLSGQMVYPVADDLMTRNIPFVFVTGYSATQIPASYRQLPRLEKPFEPRALQATLERLLARH